MIVRLSLLLIYILTLTACAGAPGAISKLNATEIQSVKAENLCFAVAFYRQRFRNENRENMEAEVKRRGLTCAGDIAREKRYSEEYEAKYGTAKRYQAEAKEKEERESARQNRQMSVPIDSVDTDNSWKDYFARQERDRKKHKEREAEVKRAKYDPIADMDKLRDVGVNFKGTKEEWVSDFLSLLERESPVKHQAPWDHIKHKNPTKDYSRKGYAEGLYDRYKRGYLAYNFAAQTGGWDRYYWALETNPSPDFFNVPGVKRKPRKSKEQEDKEWKEYVRSDEYMAKRMESWDRQDEMAGVLLLVGMAVFLRNAPMAAAEIAPQLASLRFIRSIPKGLSPKMEGLTVLDTKLKNTITAVAPKGTIKNMQGHVFKRLRTLEESGITKETKTIVIH